MDREPTWITQERAKQIWAEKGPFGDFHVTPEEDAEISRVWKTLSGDTSWADALLSIVAGRHPTVPR